MEKRRLQRTGGASLTVTLPKEWVKKQSLSGSQQVAMYAQSSGTLLIKPMPISGTPSPAILNFKNLTPEMGMREAVALFIAGVNEIEFRSANLTQTQRSHIRSIADRLIGFEIIDESSDKVVIRNILDIAKLPIPDMVDKMFLLARSMLEDAINAAIEGNADTAQDIIGRDREIDKLHLVITRQFHSVLADRILEEELGLDRSAISYYRTAALQLERIADHAVKIAKTIVPSKSVNASTTKALSPALTELFNIFSDVKTMSRTANQGLAHKVLNQGNDLEDRLVRLRQQSRQNTALFVILLDSLDRTRGYLMNIAEATIDHATV